MRFELDIPERVEGPEHFHLLPAYESVRRTR